MKNKIIKELLGGAVLAAEAAAILTMAFTANRVFGSTGRLTASYVYYCEKAGAEYNICPELLQAVAETESGGDPDAVGQAGEIGLMQVYPRHHRARAEHLGVYDLSDPEGNILVGADYLAELFEEYEDAGTALMVYNGTKDAAERGRKGDYTDYAKNIMERAAQLERENGK